MKNKILVELIVPEIEMSYDIYIPINKKIGTIINLLQKSIFELSDGDYVPTKTALLYSDNGERYDINSYVKDTSIKHGTRIILM